jgi:hypothetical protein
MHPPSSGWAEFTIMMEVRQKAGIASLFVLSRLWSMQYKKPGEM